MFGPSHDLSGAEIQARIADLRGAERAEAEELFTRTLTGRHRRFRARLDDLADGYEAAVQAANRQRGRFHDLIRWGLGLQGLPRWQLLRDQERVMRHEIAKLRAIDAPTAREYRAEQIRWHEQAVEDLQPVWTFVARLEALLHDEFPTLGTLPWTPDWLLRLAADRPPETRYGAGGPRLSGVFSGGMIPTLRFEPAGLDIAPIEVDGAESREEARQRLVAALERDFYRRYLAEQREPPQAVEGQGDRRKDRRFRRWLKRNDEWSRVSSALKPFLDESHPRGTRPYTRDPLRQVRRDVGLWAAVRIDGHTPFDLAADHADRADREPDFRSRSGGRRPRLPATEKGVKDAVGRAQRLLEQREI